ncbi:CDP-diacylglycerol--serine O-phosphatidyltransferase [Candidimonas sp. SYP-B2681]|uniref:CDP-diacylglycerol--serine O-phosphatidyltransferase n=1 Tax=Candidimonas sp. SYP-B2681 TaxID=2497686 RepID=UPI000F877989|nr:CDP-diacylglycerol--serine O-phosphatidyltransferase [Candidimonas sp. SYP-B2681]RTZ42401.1 CDP-diacylglycerol--serine O-phosphatidyltransferase [Candidimonas sp. SYP-B2681]
MPNFSSDEARRRSIYLLPNAFTTANLFAGFYAVVQAMNGQFEMAAIAIFLAMVFDGMDGRVARLTNTQSAFGEQYDSLSDMTSFGIAPALVMYEWSLQGLGRWGWLAAFIYVVGAALRLARFNTNIGVVDKRFFQGLPSPAAAALVAGFLWLAVDNKLSLQNETIAWLSFGFTVYAGIAMVTNAPFYSGKSFALGRSVPFWVMLLLVGAFVFVSSDPPIVLFSLFVVYGLSGWAIMFWRWRRARELTRLRQEGIEERDTPIAPTFTAPHTYQLPESEIQRTDTDQRSPPSGNIRGPDGP